MRDAFLVRGLERSLETDGDDGVSDVEEARGSPSARVRKALSLGGGPSSAS